MRRGGTVAAALLALAAGVAMLGVAAGVAAPSPLDAPRERLRVAKLEADRAEARAQALERQAAAALTAADRAAAQQRRMAARIEAAEAEHRAAEARVALVGRLLAERRDELARRRDPIVRLMAALQSLARRPAVAAVAQPGSTADAVHVRAVLATVLPAVRQRTGAIRAEVTEVQRTRHQAALALQALGTSRRRLEDERLQLVRVEAQQRLRSRDLGRIALVESDRAIALGERARDIVDQMEESEVAAVTAHQLETLSGPLLRPGSDATPFHRSPYRLPVAGRVVTGFGEISDAGVRARGLTLAVEPGARIVAPLPGRVLLARSFRSYGTILLIDHGDGWTTLITGLSRASVARGTNVAAGTPLGIAPGGDAPRITIELRRHGEAIDLATMLG
ncbi:peptidoglycan DD-metalloendopeptidase family protein [Sphingomonas sp. PL-96]|uniref:murein hydrolase activator EnvC family protein n=1 Tax=Sphingomonas sp. PL-96 TaxID=2887201 RepID=UPI001E537B83|nr:peptidoglycan DD-metalloendopeptidase family protein [Sphingomonas sp. PL-96]MCC2977545.1 peptidoglycan DD-metalloendopeptidase family protein [Sphingomonas sp. PL-96]